MVEFDSLPPKSRSLILATLGLEIASANSKSVFDLARKRNQSVADVWRDVCRKTGQPRCTMPPRVTRPDYVATDEPSTAVWAEFAAAPHPPAAAHDMSTLAAHASVTGLSQTKGATTVAQRSQGRTVALAAGLFAILAIGIGLIVMMPRSSEQTALTSARPAEAVRIKSNETARTDRPTVDANSVPTPQGTARRMEEINKAFKR